MIRSVICGESYEEEGITNHMPIEACSRTFFWTKENVVKNTNIRSFQNYMGVGTIFGNLSASGVFFAAFLPLLRRVGGILGNFCDILHPTAFYLQMNTSQQKTTSDYCIFPGCPSISFLAPGELMFLSNKAVGPHPNSTQKSQQDPPCWSLCNKRHL